MTGFESFAIVELMGHARIAGKVTEAELFGTALLRVDVPKTAGCEAFTKYYSAGAIYCITPTDEATARLAAEKFEEKPVQAWILPADPLLAAKVRSAPDFFPDDYGDDGTDDAWDDDEILPDDDVIDVGEDNGLPVRASRLPRVESLTDRERAIRRSKELMEREFVIFDTETTGFEDNDEIIQIAIIDQTGATILKSYIKPTQPITNSEYHSIIDETVQDAPTFPELYPKLEAALNGKLWLAYNLDYDARMLRQVCQRHELSELIPSRGECVMLLYADFYGGRDQYHGNNRWQKLDIAIERLELKREGSAHDAESDAKATLEVLKAMAAVETKEPEVAKDPSF